LRRQVVAESRGAGYAVLLGLLDVLGVLKSEHPLTLRASPSGSPGKVAAFARRIQATRKGLTVAAHRAVEDGIHSRSSRSNASAWAFPRCRRKDTVTAMAETEETTTEFYNWNELPAYRKGTACRVIPMPGVERRVTVRARGVRGDGDGIRSLEDQADRKADPPAKRLPDAMASS
jgi:hypothetical protein